MDFTDDNNRLIYGGISISPFWNSNVIDNMDNQPKGNTYSELLYWYMNHPVKITQEELSNRTGISTSTIRRMLSAEKYNHNPDIRAVIACIVGLHIDFIYSEKLLTLAGYNLLLDTKRNKIYRRIINLYYNASVTDCNNLLMAQNETPLTANKKIVSPHAVE